MAPNIFVITWALASLFTIAAADNSWNFQNVISKQQALAQATLVLPNISGTASAQLVQVLNEVKMTLMYLDWCQEFGLASPIDQVAFNNFKVNMVQVFTVNLDASIPWWASGNRFSHLNSSSFAALYLGALPPTSTQQQHHRRELHTREAAPAAAATRAAQATAGTNSPAPSSGPQAHRSAFGINFPPFYPFNNLPTPAPTPKPTSPTPAPTPNLAPTPNPTPSQGGGVNWVAQGKVTPVRNQGGCGSCWAFVATALVESAYLMTGRGSPSTLDLSEEQLTSCVNPSSSPYNGNGCNGGWIDNALNFVAWSDLVTESVWPYNGQAQSCGSGHPSASPSSGSAVKLSSGAVQVSPGSNQQALKNAVLSSPVGVYFMADSSFQNYHGGIYTATSCTTSINHALTVVGWGYDSGSSSYYWLVKNSWGTGWGESGFARIQMTGDGPGPCGMYQWAYAAPANSFSSSPLNNV